MADTATLAPPTALPSTPPATPTSAATPDAKAVAAPVVVPDAKAPPAVALGTPEPKPDDKKEAPPAAVVPEKYELKLPPDSTLDPDAIERTAATARALGLTNDAAQTALDFVNSEVQQMIADRAKGGEIWGQQVEAWNAALLADPEIGGTQERLNATQAAATRVLSRHGTPELGQLLAESGYGSHPAVIRFFANVAKATGESALILPSVAEGGRDQKPLMDRLREQYAETSGPRPSPTT